MKNKSIKSKIIAGALMASMMISATAVFAADITSNATTQKGGFGFSGGGHKDLKTVLGNLLTAGTITSDKETAIENALAPQGGAKDGKHKDMFTAKLAELVTAGTITSDEQTAITTALTSAKGDFKTALADLVTAGTITSTQETAIETAITPQGVFKDGDHKDMFTNKLAELVTSGTITSDEQTAIETALASSK